MNPLHWGGSLEWAALYLVRSYLMDNNRVAVPAYIYRSWLLIMFFNKFKPLTAEQAKAKVFEHWKHLDAAARRRFPGHENLAHQAVLFALDQLENNQWKRVRAWEGKGSFLTFLITLVSRLFTDYARKQFGYSRPPKWLQDKSDATWNKAYRLLQIEQYQRQEAIELLHSHFPDQALADLEPMVAEILSRCQHRPQLTETTLTLDQCEEPASVQQAPLQQLMLDSNELIEILSHYLDRQDSQSLPPQVQTGIIRLQSQLSLNKADRMLLYLRYVEGLSITVIVDRLHLTGSPYKRLNRLIESLQQACQQTGLTIDLDDTDESTGRLK